MDSAKKNSTLSKGTDCYNECECECGFVYIASNNVGGMNDIDYIQEAIFSANSLLLFNPSAKITLFCDCDISVNSSGKDFSVFTEVVNLGKDVSLRCKQDILMKSKYDKIIYIDSDTYINWNLDDLFQLLDTFDFMACHDYSRKRIFDFMPEYMSIPYGFSELNGGILCFRKNDIVNNVFEDWSRIYHKYRKMEGVNLIWDQPSFRVAIWNGILKGMKFYCLPQEYNRRNVGCKQKCVNLRCLGDKRFSGDHLRTRIFHFHGIEKMLGGDVNGRGKGGVIVEQNANEF